MTVFNAGLEPVTTNFNPGNFNPGNFNPGNFNPGDIGCIRCSNGCYVKNAGDIALLFLDVSNTSPRQSA